MYLAKSDRELQPGMVASVASLYAYVVLVFRASFSAASARTTSEDEEEKCLSSTHKDLIALKA